MFDNNKIRFGVLGCANIAVRSVIPAIASHPACRLEAIASRSCGKTAPLAAQYGCRALGYDELVADPAVDAIYIPLPTGLHFEWVMKALVAGKHVLCEKSLGCTVNEVQQMVEQARCNNRLLMETFQFRFHSQHAVARAILDSGILGEVRGFRATFGFPPFADGATNIRYQKALGGGALLDAGAYTLKATTYMLGFGFHVKAAALHFTPEFEVDIGGAIFLENASNLVSQTAFGFDNFYQCNYEIWGSLGKLTAKRAFTAPPGFAPQMVIETAEGVEIRTLPPDDHFANMLTYFIDTIRSCDFETEYNECLIQADLLAQALEQSGFGPRRHKDAGRKGLE